MTSLVEAVLEQQAEEREQAVAEASRPVPRPQPRSRRSCACGCGRPLDARNKLGFARPCLAQRLVTIWANASPAFRARMLRLLGPGRAT